MSVLRVRAAVAERAGRAVPLPDLDIGTPGVIHVVGPNGAGKSTLLEAIAGTLRLRSGEATIGGVPATRAHALRRLCRAEPALLGRVPLGLQSRLFAAAASVPAVDAERALAAWGLAHRASADPCTLSTGELRAAWVTLCTLGSAPVLLLDEPFAGLDAAAAERLACTIEAWGRERVVLVVDHGSHLRGVRARVEVGEHGA